MTLSREEIAVRLAASLLTGYASRGPVSVDRNRLACDAIHYADGLLLALPPTPAPVAPPAGKYEPRVGDVVRWGTIPHVYVVTRVSPELGGMYCEDRTWREWFGGEAPHYCEFVRKATPSELAAAGLAVPPPATAGEGLDDIERAAKALADFKGTIPPGASDAFMLGWRVRDREAPCDGVARTTNAPTPAPEAKRPTVIRLTSAHAGLPVDAACRVLAWHGDTPLVRGAPGYGDTYIGAGKWAPAPCPPPVAGSEVEAFVKAASAYCAVNYLPTYDESRVRLHHAMIEAWGAYARPIHP